MPPLVPEPGIPEMPLSSNPSTANCGTCSTARPAGGDAARRIPVAQATASSATSSSRARGRRAFTIAFLLPRRDWLRRFRARLGEDAPHDALLVAVARQRLPGPKDHAARRRQQRLPQVLLELLGA